MGIPQPSHLDVAVDDHGGVQAPHIGVVQDEAHLAIGPGTRLGPLGALGGGGIVVIVRDVDQDPLQGVAFDRVGVGPAVLLPDVEVQGCRRCGDGHLVHPHGEQFHLDSLLVVSEQGALGVAVIRLGEDVPYGRGVEPRGQVGAGVDAGGLTGHGYVAFVGAPLEHAVDVKGPGVGVHHRPVDAASQLEVAGVLGGHELPGVVVEHEVQLDVFGLDDNAIGHAGRRGGAIDGPAPAVDVGRVIQVRLLDGERGIVPSLRPADGGDGPAPRGEGDGLRVVVLGLPVDHDPDLRRRTDGVGLVVVVVHEDRQWAVVVHVGWTRWNEYAGYHHKAKK